MAKGDTSTPQGKASFKVVIENNEFWPQLTIADIEVPMIIGYVFMFAHNCSLDIGNGRLKLGRKYIKCHQEAQNRYLFRICLDRDVTVPPGTEMIIGGKIDLNEPSLLGISEMIIEPKAESDLSKKGILMAKALVNPNSQRIPIRVMNLSDRPQPLFSRTIAATTEIVESVTTPKTVTASCPQKAVRSISEINLDEMPEHIKDVWEANVTTLSVEQQKHFFNLLIKHQSVFAASKYDLGRTDLVQHEIDTGDHPPIKQPARRIPLNKRKIAEEEVKKMLEHNIIEPSTSPWSSPIVLVEKKDHSTRFCVDYRRLNNVTRKDSYPLQSAQYTGLF